MRERIETSTNHVIRFEAFTDAPHPIDNEAFIGDIGGLWFTEAGGTILSLSAHPACGKYYTYVSTSIEELELVDKTREDLVAEVLAIFAKHELEGIVTHYDEHLIMRCKVYEGPHRCSACGIEIEELRHFDESTHECEDYDWVYIGQED